MRADKRSFSFTWMRGQKGSGDQPGNNTSSTTNSTEGASNSTWFMTTASSTSSSSGVSSMSESSSIASNQGSGEETVKENGSLSKSDTSKSRLRRLGSSFTRFGTKYSIIEDDDEEQQQQQQKTPAPLQFENQMAMEVEEEVVVAVPPKAEPVKEPMHFDEDGNFIGRHGKTGSATRKSSVSGKEGGNASGTSSFGRKLNKTVQDVKASLGSFSQKFRRSTRRRYRIPGTPLTEVTPTRRILGRTPTKLYSPFGIGLESPAMKTPKRLTTPRPSTPRLTRRSMVSGLVYSPANNFRNDLADARRGMEDFHILTRDITRRSVRF